MATIPLQFKKAVKYDAKGRIALTGPSGAGKSLTTLKLAQLLAGEGGRVAAIDTEHGSLSKYADLFDFDVIELDSYSPENFLEALTAAEKANYQVFCCDSLSHFWMGKDGALEFVDNAKKLAQARASNGRVDDMAGWKDFRPHEREMIDRMISSPCHIIVTLRTKTAYEEQVNERTGKKQRVKIGLAPVQREGLEYEFDLVGLMNDDNELLIDKTRCSSYAGTVIKKPKAADFQPFADWLKGEKKAEPAPAPPPPPPPSTSVPPRERPAAAKAAPEAKPAAAAAPDVPQVVADMWKIMATEKAGGFSRVFAGFLTTFERMLGEQEGADVYNLVLGLHGVDSWQSFKSLQKARQCVLAMYHKVEELHGSNPEQSISLPSEAA